MPKNSIETFEAELQRKAAIIEKDIDNIFPKALNPYVMNESMRYSLFSGGKRIRAILLKECCDMAMGDMSAAIVLACAVEMIHSYSLIHDDLPCMDDDDLRRGKPSNHIKYGYAQALLAGDGLLNLAYETMIGYYEHSVNKEKYMRAVDIIASAAGTKGMILGQCADILSEDKVLDQDQIKFINDNKTGALLKACVNAGAVLGNVSDKQAIAFNQYGMNLGEMFQLVDDKLDMIGKQSLIGKPVGSDEKKSKKTFIALNGIEKTNEKINKLYEICVSNAKECSEKSEFLCDMAFYIKERNK